MQRIEHFMVKLAESSGAPWEGTLGTAQHKVLADLENDGWEIASVTTLVNGHVLMFWQRPARASSVVPEVESSTSVSTSTFRVGFAPPPRPE